MKGFKRLGIAALVALGSFGAVGVTPKPAIAESTVARRPPGSTIVAAYAVYDAAGRLVGYIFVDSSGRQTFVRFSAM